MNIRIRRSECCGNALCTEIAPEVFAIDAQHKSTVLDPEAASRESVLEAAEACPCQAIVIEDDDGNVLSP